MDSAISITITLFILSMINERIANFIKLQYSETKKLGISFGNLKRKTTGDDEKNREKRILLVNIIVGSFVALALRADLISILGHFDAPSKGIGWNQGFIWWNIITIPIGCILTGCFISLGSKFWHDLLDILLLTKNLKEKIIDQRTYKPGLTADQLQEFVLTSESNLAMLADAQYHQNLMSLPGVLAVGTGILNYNGNKIGCLEIHISNLNFSSQIMPSYPVKISSGYSVDVPAKVLVTGQIPSVHSVSAADGIANSLKVLGSGTLGAIVKDNVSNEIYLLSCFHVLNGSTNWNSLSDKRTIIENNKDAEVEIADLVMGYRTNQIDAGIAKIRSGIPYSNNSIGNPKSFREVKSVDSVNEIKVHFLGSNSTEKKDGILYNDTWSASFKYPDGSIWELTDLVVLTQIDKLNNSNKPISEPGDSGAIVFDEKNTAIAMIVGADDFFSYGIKIHKVMKSFDISFI